jgi:hypothetical protein
MPEVKPDLSQAVADRCLTVGAVPDIVKLILGPGPLLILADIRVGAGFSFGPLVGCIISVELYAGTALPVGARTDWSQPCFQSTSGSRTSSPPIAINTG